MMMSGGEAARPGRPGPAGARGVLLYYFYPSSTGTTGGGGAERGARVGGEVRFTAAEREELARFYEATLREAGGVVGRVRVALDGLNATLGGPVDALKLHVRDVRAHPLLSALGAAGIDFKLQRYPESDGEEDPARAAQVRAETGFDRLSVRRVLEVISMGSQERPRAGGEDADAGCSGRGGDALAARAPLHGAGVHLDPSEWHAALAGAARGDEEVLLLDARNWYERRIGGFAAARVGCLDAKLRSFGELPAWIERAAAPALVSAGASASGTPRLGNTGRRRTRVLMYCTGGVRCERASSLLNTLLSDARRRAGDAGLEADEVEVEVHQLRGGIQRYLEAYPDGGFFRGVNFVFDDRISVPPASRARDPHRAAADDVVGRCLLCSAATEDYSPRLRCGHCRMLVLVCPACVRERGGAIDARCELCVLHNRV